LFEHFDKNPYEIFTGGLLEGLFGIFYVKTLTAQQRTETAP
jgi:hypothetical protein